MITQNKDILFRSPIMNKLMVYAYTGVVITMLFWGSA
ncbi:EamA/RhaT family transporter, partial [Acinetobacter baumannii]